MNDKTNPAQPKEPEALLETIKEEESELAARNAARVASLVKSKKARSPKHAQFLINAGVL